MRNKKEKVATDKKIAKQKKAKEVAKKAVERRRAQEQIAEHTIKGSKALQNLIEKKSQEKGEAYAQLKIDRLMMEIPNAKIPRKANERTYRKFSCPELCRMFNGWFTLAYAFSIKNEDETDTDFYICSADVSGVAVNDRPNLNAAIKQMFDKDVYGFAIIAPSTAFN